MPEWSLDWVSWSWGFITGLTFLILFILSQLRWLRTERRQLEAIIRDLKGEGA